MSFQLSFLPQMAAIFMLMFARLGTMVMLMPSLSETAIPVRLRLSVALALTLLLFPVVSHLYPPAPMDNFGELLKLMAGEFFVGFAIGLVCRLVTSALQTAGVIMASQSGLSFALSSDLTNSGQQGALLGNYLSLLGATLVFVTNAHYLTIAALYDSFTLFTPGQWIPAGDFATVATKTVSGVFSIATRLSAPFIVVGLVFYFGLGLLNKLMPQLQIFFLAMPVNIALGIFLLALLLVSMMTVYMEFFQKTLGQFTTG